MKQIFEGEDADTQYQAFLQTCKIITGLFKTNGKGTKDRQILVYYEC